ncbi:MAG: AmmeMemoRadiSam system protein B [Gammaproteobacteria bacterium]|nr:AmmeMemoRadiSam system protein B [Gammaproteobacteria bacterium]
MSFTTSDSPNLLSRQPAVAGLFYPADPDELHEMVQDMLQNAHKLPGHQVKALIAPHAGYIYSGPIAASAYVQLYTLKDKIKRVILLGPSHRVPFHGLACSSADYFHTPLGDIPVDKDALEQVASLPQIQMLDQAHQQEHSLEVHLPFLQEVLDEFVLVPLVVGDASADEVAQVLDILWGGDETLIVISSDLSHYHDYDTAQQMDNETSYAIESLRPDDIKYDSACGRNPVNGLLRLARKRGLHATTIDLRNSGDTAGPRDHVVGYGAYLFNDGSTTD